MILWRTGLCTAALLTVTSILAPSFVTAAPDTTRFLDTESDRDAGQETPLKEPPSDAGVEPDAGAQPDADIEPDADPGADAPDGEADEGDCEPAGSDQREGGPRCNHAIEDTVIEYGDEETPDTVDGEELTPDMSGPQADVQAPGGAVELEPGADKDTGVKGRVVSRKPRKALPDAPVTAKGRDGKVRSAITGSDGRFQLLLPPGRYTLHSFYDLYHGARWDDIVVKRGKFSTVNFILDAISKKDAGVEEQEVAYLADTSSEAAQLEIRKEQVSQQDAISAEEISRSGDSDASGAATRVVGATIDNDGRLIVRGLGGRYTRVLMNGVSIPSTDPDEPGVQLDLIPTDILSSFAIVKTARPDLPGDFAGGIGLVDTVLFPKEFTLKAGGKVGFNTLTTFKNRLDYSGGRRDWLGFDDGTRSLPGGIKGQKFGRVPDELAAQFDDVWDFDQKKAIPNLGVDASVGDTVGLKGKRRLGYLALFGYGLDQVRRTGQRRKGALQIQQDGTFSVSLLDTEVGRQTASLIGFGTATLELNPEHRLTLLLFYNREADREALFQDGFDRENSNRIEDWELGFLARQIIFNQLSGDHQNLGNTRLRLRWTLFDAFALREDPNRRNVTYVIDDADVRRWTAATGSGRRSFADLDQRDLGALLSLRFPMWQEAYGTVGGRIRSVHREFRYRSFNFRAQPGVPLSEFALDANELFADEQLGQLVRLVDETDTTGPDAYDGDQLLVAGYVKATTPIGKKFKTEFGLRTEVFKQEVAGFSLLGDLNEKSSRTWIDPLPSLSTSYEVAKSMFIRTAYGMTVVRPEFREQAPFRFFNPLRGSAVTGNPDLQRTRIHNVDLRWEWFFGDADLVAVTGFFKNFDQPIEEQVFLNGDTQYQNAEGARVYGAELELRMGLGRLHTKLDRFALGANATIVQSRVRLTAEQQSTTTGNRPLFGQSPYVTNLSLRFDDPDAGVTGAIVYNTFGERIVGVGVRATTKFVTPNIKEQPFHKLDLVIGYKPTKHVNLKLKAENLLFQSRRFKQGGTLVFKENYGAKISIGAEYQY